MALVAAHPAFGDDGSIAVSGGAVEVTSLGQSAMRIKTPGGKTIVVDPS